MSYASNVSLADAVLKMAQDARGNPFPSSAVADLGGWQRIASESVNLVGHPTLPILAFLVARDARPGDTDAAIAAGAVAEAVIATVQPALLRDSLDALLDSAVVTQAVGDRLVAGLEPVAAAFLAREDREPLADLASADALDAMTRLVAAGHGSHFALLALLEKFRVPTVASMSRAVIRSVSTAVDVWPAADSLVKVVRALGGLDAVAGGDPRLAAEVESDATWVLAMASLLRSLRAASVQAMSPHLDEAERFLQVAAVTYTRSDASAMLSVVNALRELVAGVMSNDTKGALGTPPLSREKLAGIRDQVLRFTIESSGLDHWYGDSKTAALTAWAELAADLEQMSHELNKDGFYQTEIVVRNLLTVYVSSRTFRVGAREADIVGVQDLIQPVIEGGFALNASHLSNLEEYAASLASRDTADLDQQSEAQLQAARNIIEIARRVAKGDGAPGKAEGGALYTPLPPLLGRLVPLGSPDAHLLGQVSPDTIAAIEQHLDHVNEGRRHLNLVQQELFDNLRRVLASSPDYKGDVVQVVDEILLLILNFVVSRTGSQGNHHRYLFDKTATEDSIHEDLYDYLVGNLGNRAEYEVPHVGGGRVDIRLKFDTFALHVEMKVDSTKLPMHDRTAYLKQAATYQGNDIRIGFLIALRHKAFDPTGPPPHITALIGHTAFDIQDDPIARHIVHVALPGSRINPSASK